MELDVEVLILTSDLDFATDRVCQELTTRSVPFLRLNREHLTSLALTLDPITPTLTCEHRGEIRKVGASLKSVWWRQGTFDRNISDQGYSLEEQMARSQWPAFMRSMMAFQDAKWVNHPAAVYLAETKAVQLTTAKKLGFQVPATLMTNDPAAPVGHHIGAQIALKSIDTFLLKDGQDQLFGYTTITTWPSLDTCDLAQAPVTAQQALTGKRDLRVTVIGSRAWCVEITRNDIPVEGDWRLTPKNEICIHDVEIPEAEKQRCISLVRGLNLSYGAIDLAITADGYWFIEINPTGEWGWLDCPERPLAGTIAEHLACR